MIFREQSLPGVYLIDPELREDDRGFFARVWCEEEFAAFGLTPRVAQANISFSRARGLIRGMHYQVEPHAEAKTIRCTQGAIFDVVIDLRPDSTTHGQWFGATLTANNHRMLYVPEGFAHGFQTLSTDVEVTYQVSARYAAGAERGVRHDDPAFGIEWPAPVTRVSEKDQSWPDYSAPIQSAPIEGVERDRAIAEAVR